MKLFAFALFAFLTCCQETDAPSPPPTVRPPNPKLQWPTTFHAWIVVTVVDQALNQTYILNKDNGNPIRSTDFCDYDTGLHYAIAEDDNQNTPCSLRKALDPPRMIPFAWPAAFFDPDECEYHGIDKQCNHFLNTNFELDKQNIQMDIWTRTEYPCQISAHVVDSPNLLVNWGFVAFSPIIPIAAKRCTAPRVICDEKGWVCRPVKDVNDTDYYSMAIHYACSTPNTFDCSPINPGGKYYMPNDLMSHCTWVFQAYFEKFKMLLGEDACMYGVAELVKPNSEGSDEVYVRSIRSDIDIPWKTASDTNKYYGEPVQTKSSDDIPNPLMRYLKQSLSIPSPINALPNDLVCV